jgi:hypothetical protein
MGVLSCPCRRRRFASSTFVRKASAGGKDTLSVAPRSAPMASCARCGSLAASVSASNCDTCNKFYCRQICKDGHECNPGGGGAAVAVEAVAVVGNHDAAASAAATLLALGNGRISRLQQIEQRRKEIQEEAKRLSAQECIASQTTSTSEYLAPTRHRLHGIPCRRKNLHQGRRKRRQVVLPHTRRSAPPERDATKLDFGILRHNKK